MFYTYNDKFTEKQGFNFAVAFSAYDDNPEPILDPEYGELVFNHYYWGVQEDGTYGAGRKRINTTHTCSEKELGLEYDDEKTIF